MNSVIAPLAERPPWSAFSACQKAIGALDLRKLFVDDPARGKRLARAALGICLDYSKLRISTSP